ncbi:MAG: hypothetical protein AVDCRST_MAG68-1001, partial [uncultured Gemmatimonadetes bacterium]
RDGRRRGCRGRRSRRVRRVRVPRGAVRFRRADPDGVRHGVAGRAQPHAGGARRGGEPLLQHRAGAGAPGDRGRAEQPAPLLPAGAGGARHQQLRGGRQRLPPHGGAVPAVRRRGGPAPPAHGADGVQRRGGSAQPPGHGRRARAVGHVGHALRPLPAGRVQPGRGLLHPQRRGARLGGVPRHAGRAGPRPGRHGDRRGDGRDARLQPHGDGGGGCAALRRQQLRGGGGGVQRGAPHRPQQPRRLVQPRAGAVQDGALAGPDPRGHAAGADRPAQLQRAHHPVQRVQGAFGRGPAGEQHGGGQHQPPARAEHADGRGRAPGADQRAAAHHPRGRRAAGRHRHRRQRGGGHAHPPGVHLLRPHGPGGHADGDGKRSGQERHHADRGHADHDVARHRVELPRRQL